MDSFKDRNLSNGLFFLELLSAVKPTVVSWNLVTKGESDEEKKLNATYIISVAQKLGCCIFLLPEDIMEVCLGAFSSFQLSAPDSCMYVSSPSRVTFRESEREKRRTEEEVADGRERETCTAAPSKWGENENRCSRRYQNSTDFQPKPLDQFPGEATTLSLSLPGEIDLHRKPPD